MSHLLVEHALLEWPARELISGDVIALTMDLVQLDLAVGSGLSISIINARVIRHVVSRAVAKLLEKPGF